MHIHVHTRVQFHSFCECCTGFTHECNIFSLVSQCSLIYERVLHSILLWSLFVLICFYHVAHTSISLRPNSVSTLQTFRAVVKIVEQSCRKYEIKYDDKVSKLFYLKELDKKKERIILLKLRKYLRCRWDHRLRLNDDAKFLKSRLFDVNRVVNKHTFCQHCN